MPAFKGTTQKKKFGASDYDLYTAYIINFVDHIKWPNQAGGYRGYKARLRLAGDHFFTETHIEAFNEKGLQVNDNVSQHSDFDMIFVPHGHTKLAREIIKANIRKPTLTISDLEGFHQHGGDIEFTILHLKHSDRIIRKVVLVLNEKRLMQKGLQCSKDLEGHAISASDILETT